MVNQVLERLSYSTNINSLASYTSEMVILSNYNSLIFTFATDVALSMTLGFSNDGVYWDTNLTYPIPVTTNWKESTPVLAAFTRITLTNTSLANSTVLRVKCYGVVPAVVSEVRILDNIGGQNSSFDVANLPLSAFGEIKTATQHTYSPYKFSSSQINALPVTFTSGNLKTGYRTLQFQANNTALAYGQVAARGTLNLSYPAIGLGALWTRVIGKPVLYQSSTAMCFRFTTIFDASEYVQPVTGRDEQYIGIGNVIDSTTQVPLNFLGVGYSGSADALVGSEFGIFYIRNQVKVFIPQTAWSLDVLNGSGNSGMTLDPFKGNIWQIDMGYLGFSQIRFSVMNGGNWLPVHVLDFPNITIETTVTDPSFAFLMQFNKTIPLLVYPIPGSPLMGSASYAAILYSDYNPSNYTSYEGIKTIPANTETPVVILRNPPTWFSRPNTVLGAPLLLSASSDGTKNVVVRVYQTSTAGIGGVPVWVDVDSNYSPMQYSLTGTLASGVKVFAFTLIKAASAQIDFSNFKILAGSDVCWVITGQSTAVSDLDISLSWSEIH